MNLQVLVTTMYAKDFSKVDEMNLRNVDVVIANQTDYCAYEERDFPERNVHAIMVSTNTRGVSVNRNMAMAYASADILIFADDDMVFTENFASQVRTDFESVPQMDAIKYYCESDNQDRPLSYRGPAKLQRVNRLALMSAGVIGFAVRRASIERYGIFFHTDLGPGRIHSSGEDGVFFKEVFDSKMKVYASPMLIAVVRQESSSWFTDYNDRYFVNAGYIYAILYGHLARLAALRKALKAKRIESGCYSRNEIYQLLVRGIKEYRG